MTEQVQVGATKHHSLDHLEPVDLPFRWAGRPTKIQRSKDSLMILAQTVGKASEQGLIRSWEYIV